MDLRTWGDFLEEGAPEMDLEHEHNCYHLLNNSFGLQGMVLSYLPSPRWGSLLPLVSFCRSENWSDMSKVT